MYYDQNMHNSFIEKRNAVNKKVYKFNFEITDKELEGGQGSSSKAQRPPKAINLMLAEDDDEDEDDEIQTGAEIDINGSADQSSDDDDNDENNNQQNEDDGKQLGGNEKA